MLPILSPQTGQGPLWPSANGDPQPLQVMFDIAGEIIGWWKAMRERHASGEGNGQGVRAPYL
jgi:hypothetical protein